MEEGLDGDAEEDVGGGGAGEGRGRVVAALSGGQCASAANSTPERTSSKLQMARFTLVGPLSQRQQVIVVTYCLFTDSKSAHDDLSYLT